ncbi:hypothetical protein, partial [Nocardia wallacei]|uniref:hypothetical protein n=1 Tax=Nocardia wallacei TaxID=480035 RepID=UPI002455A30B
GCTDRRSRHPAQHLRMTGGGRDPGGVGEESGSAANRVVDARAAARRGGAAPPRRAVARQLW